MKEKKTLKPTNKKGQAHGLWNKYWPDSELNFICTYHNDKEIGYEEYHYSFNEKIYWLR